MDTKKAYLAGWRHAYEWLDDDLFPSPEFDREHQDAAERMFREWQNRGCPESD